MSLKDNYDLENLVNEAERLVFSELETRLREYDNICKCQDCVMDMAAYALNHTKPYYRVSLMGTIYAHSDRKSTRLNSSHIPLSRMPSSA